MGKVVDLDLLYEDAGDIIVGQYVGKARIALKTLVDNYQRGISSYIASPERQKRASVKILAHLLAMRDVSVKTKYKEVMAEVARKREEYLKMLLPEVAKRTVARPVLEVVR